MDPDKALEEIRAKLAKLDRLAELAEHKAEIDELVEQFNALDEWLQKGGFLPRDWT